MNFPIPTFKPEMQYYCVWEDAFTKEECDSIVQVCELLEFERGKVGMTDDASDDSEIRDSKITWLHPNEQNDWIHKKIGDIFSRVNFDKFQVILSEFESPQYTKYTPDQHYTWHNDVLTHPPVYNLFRKLSLSIALSEPDEYEGGEFEINAHGGEKSVFKTKLKKGSLIAFYSFVPHRVTPVTSGERTSLVAWALGPKLE